jgi:hypothetical protein
MEAIVGKQRQIVSDRSGSNQEVHVADHLTQLSQSSALARKDPSTLGVDIQNRGAVQEISWSSF